MGIWVLLLTAGSRSVIHTLSLIHILATAYRKRRMRISIILCEGVAMEVRYAHLSLFVGRTLNGYCRPECYIIQEAIALLHQMTLARLHARGQYRNLKLFLGGNLSRKDNIPSCCSSFPRTVDLYYILPYTLTDHLCPACIFVRLFLGFACRKRLSSTTLLWSRSRRCRLDKTTQPRQRL